MNSPSKRRLVFLDADVLATPVTRSLILFAWQERSASFTVAWSPTVEAEADRALIDQWEKKPAQWTSAPLMVSALRGSAQWVDPVLVRDSTDSERSVLGDTNTKDQHVLAAAHAAGASLVITGNIGDFGRKDLTSLGVSVAHPDLFLASVISQDMYEAILTAMAEHRSRPPRTPEAIHASLGRTHPRLVDAMRSAFPGVDPLPAENVPKEVFRGSQCIVCGKPLSNPESLTSGIGPECRKRN